MGVVLLFMAFFSLFVVFNTSNSIWLTSVKTILAFSFITLCTSEILSLFQALNYWTLFSTWLSIDVILITYLTKNKLLSSWKNVINELQSKWKGLVLFEKGIFIFSGVILATLFIQGIIYPTNNWDSMSYHMARIVHWIQNESLAYYRTPHYSQLISPPFAEMVILNINLLVGNDYLSNAVQWFYLVGCLITISLIAKQLGLSSKGQLLSAFIMLCIPEVILLASSTHTELVACFFLTSSIYFLFQTSKQNQRGDYFWLGLSLGLAVATKSTSYIYIAPFIMLWFGYQFYDVVSRKVKLNVSSYVILVFVFTLINVGQYSRNYQLNQQLFGTDDSIHNYYVNEHQSPTLFLSNVIRNISLQFGVPHLSHKVYDVVSQVHDKMGLDLNEPQITSHTYDIDPLATHENNGANLYHTILLFFSLLWLLIYFKKQQKGLLIYTLCIIVSFLLFCFYLKWQPWTKLHVPFYIFYAVVLGHFLIKTLRFKWVFILLTFGFASTAILYLVFNFSRPLITISPFTSEIKMNDDRYNKYFSRFLEYYPDYDKVNNLMKEKGFKKVGLLMDMHQMEYQLFTDVYKSDVKSYHINAHNICKHILLLENNFDCIVATKAEKEILFDGKLYKNITLSNDGFLCLYIKD